MDSVEASSIAVLEAERAERERHAELIADVLGALVNGPASLDECLQQCAQAVVRRLDAAHARIWTVRDGDGTLHLRASAGRYGDRDERHRRIRISEGRVGRVAADREPYLTSELDGDPSVEDPEWLRAEELVSFVAYPLVVSNRMVGVIGVLCRLRLSPYLLRTLEPVSRAIAGTVRRHRLERALASSSKLSDLLLQQLPGVVWATDRELRFTHAAGSLLGELGATRDSLLGRSIEEYLPSDDPAPVALQAHRDALEGEHREYTVEWGGRMLEARVEPLMAAKRVIGVAGIGVDVTDQRRLQEELRQAQKMEAIGRLAGGVAHDFNNLLTSITGNAELAMLGLAEESEERESVQEVLAAARRAASLTRQLLAFGRRQVLSPRVTDLNAAIEGLMSIVRRIIGEQVEVGMKLSAEPCTVWVDPTQLDQVLLNLLLNARDAMPAGGRVTLRTVVLEAVDGEGALPRFVDAGRYCELVVEDSGTGIPPAVLPHIFEPFFTTRDTGKGTGLGLSTVYGIVKQSGGYVWAESPAAGGARLRVLLPYRGAGETKAPPPRQPVDLPRGRGIVLLVEDDESVRRLHQRVLTRSGYTVVEARDGQEALEALESGTAVDLVVSDLIMPRMGGVALARRLIADRPALPLVLMSGYAGDVLLEQGPLHPTPPLLQKPFGPEVLLEAVAAALRRAPSAG